jgi:hypothetical protein
VAGIFRFLLNRLALECEIIAKISLGRTSGAKALVFGYLNVAAEAATHKDRLLTKKLDTF